MDSVQATHLVRGQQQERGMRVVILEPDTDSRAMLRRCLNESPGFRLVGESVTWDECVALLNLYLPELLITRSSFAPVNLDTLFANSRFPVTLGLKRKDSSGAVDGGFETIGIPLDSQVVRDALQRVQTEIYRRKLDELSGLLQQYISFSPGIPRYLTSVAVEDGATPEIPAERVIFMAADGNYVRIHTDADVHEIRDTMTGMTSNLDPAQFARIHRSFIVNRAYVTSVLRKEGAAMCVLLTNGVEIPVGPNYRTEVDTFETVGKRLSA